MQVAAPSPAVAPQQPTQIRAAAEAFEALVLRELLRAARAPDLFDTSLGSGGEWRDLADRHLADVMAKGAPLGLARLLTEALRKERNG